MKAIFLAMTGLAALASTQAQALNARTWVSGKGVDQAGCGPIATPCRTLQFGHDQTNAGGEIDVLDSAGYGNIVITKAITIIADGTVAGVLAQPNNDAITINAGQSDAVILRGLTVEGQGAGAYGIRLNSGGSLTIADCVVQNFGAEAGTGILIGPQSGTSTVLVSNTTTSYNAYVGLWFSPGGSGAANLQFDRIVATNNQFNIAINTFSTTAQSTASITNSTVAHGDYGLYAGGANARLMVDRSVVTGNNIGINTAGGATTYVGRSAITKNTTGIDGNGATFSYLNNQLDANTTDIGANVTLSNATLR